MVTSRTGWNGSGLAALALLFSLMWVGVPVLNGAGVDLWQIEFWGLPLIWLGFAGVFVWSFARIGRGRSFPTWNRFGPFVLQVAVLLLVWRLDLEAAATNWNFESRMAARMEVVDLVKRGELALEQGSWDIRPTAELPARYRSLSAGGCVSVTHHQQGFSVTFYVKRVGMFPEDDYTAFIYRSGNGEPANEVEDTDHFTAVKELAPHWFLVGHT